MRAYCCYIVVFMSVINVYYCVVMLRFLICFCELPCFSHVCTVCILSVCIAHCKQGFISLYHADVEFWGEWMCRLDIACCFPCRVVVSLLLVVVSPGINACQ